MEDELQQAGKYIGSKEFLYTLLVIAIFIVLMVFVKRVLIKKVAYKSRKEHQNTIQGLLFNLLQYVIIIVTIFVVLSVNGINVTGMLAGLGIAATIIGLSLQDTFKDLFAGLNIYNNNFYKVGDYVIYNGEMCLVKYFNARVTKFSALSNGSTYTVSNNLITNIQKLKKDTGIPVMFDFDVDRKIVDEVMKVACRETEKLDTCDKVDYFGFVSIESLACKYLAFITAKPADQFFVKKKFFEVLYDECKKKGIAPQFTTDRDIIISDKHRVYSNINKKNNKRKKTH